MNDFDRLGIGTPFQVPRERLGADRAEVRLSDNRVPQDVRALLARKKAAEARHDEQSDPRRAIVEFVLSRPNQVARAAEIAEELLGISPTDPAYDPAISYIGELCRVGQLELTEEGAFKAKPFKRVGGETSSVAAERKPSSTEKPAPELPAQMSKQSLETVLRAMRTGIRPRPQGRRNSSAHKW